MAKTVTNQFDGYLFTFKAEESDEYEEFFGNWSADHGTTEEWRASAGKFNSRKGANFPDEAR